LIHDAVVIGGGPGGASAALALARQGRSVALIEKAEFPRRKVCGEFMSAVNQPLFEALGVSEAIAARAGPEVRRLGFFGPGEGLEAGMPRARGPAFGRALGRDVLDTLLLDAASSAGAELFQPWRVVAVERGADGTWLVRMVAKRKTREVHARAVIAAHGSWEPGGLPTHLPKRNRPNDYLGFKAHFRGARLPADLMPLIAFPGGYGGMVWADGGRLSLSCCVRRDKLERMRSEHRDRSAAETVEAHIRAASPAAATALDGAELDGDWLAAGPIRPGLRPCFAGGIFRVGNVAGESHPVIAEGISMALQSGWLLANELGRHEVWDEAAQAEAGRAYTRLWRRQFATRIHAASLVAGLSASPLGARLMGAVIRVLPASLSLGARVSGKTAALPHLNG
jgi:flavin-dependent dehydrogenase